MIFLKFVSLIFLSFVNHITQVFGRFELVLDTAGYDTMEPKCESLGLQAAKLETDAAYKQAVSFIEAMQGVVNPVWIGLKYEPLDQTFRWRDGTKTLRNNWYKTSSISEPDNLSTEQCVSIFKGWDNYASILTKECTKNYHILCGSYDEPMLSGIFVDVTSSEISSGSVLYKHVVPTRLYCGQMCMMDDVCTHYKIVSSSLECTLYSGKTTAGSTTSGVLYIKL